MKNSALWIVLLLLAAAPALAQETAPAIAPASLEVLSVVPASGGTLRSMERAVVTIRYVCPAGAEVHIWAQPCWQGRFTPGSFHEASGRLSGSGELTRFISAQRAAQIDAVKVLMTDTDKKPIIEIFHPVDLKWEGEPADPRKPGASAATGETTSPYIGKPFPTLAFTGLNGEAVDVAALKGKVVLVDFWATWCGPCRSEMPNLIAAYEKYHDQGFEIVAISLDQDKDKLVNYIVANPMPWPQHFDGQGWKTEIAMRFDIHSIPQSYLLDRDGIVRYASLRGRDLDKAIAVLLK